LEEVNDDKDGKVSLSASLNEKDKGIVAPYSIIADGHATVAAPLHWEELKEGFAFDSFTYKTILQRVKDVGDPFEALYKKKVNAEALLERLHTNYSFLF
jgi:bifunctional non-homologous end joining protein LigD